MLGQEGRVLRLTAAVGKQSIKTLGTGVWVTAERNAASY
jgi:hypothetical protein